MSEQTDSQLLRAYAEKRSEQAFAELVRRHVDFVYSAAQRMVCDTHLAEDVTQGAFVALAKNAAHLANCPVLSGWLHRTAQNIAAQAVRTAVRRRAREQEAATMNELLSAQPDAAWDQIAPHLDAALGDLSDLDRDALLLRYFERKSAREMAQTLGINDEAAQKRVNRAVDRLRAVFAKRGITVGAGGLVLLISANAVQAAPAGLAVAISTAAIFSATAVHTSTVIAATKAAAMTTVQKTFLTAALAAFAGTGIYQARQASTLRTQIQTLQQPQTPLAGQVLQLRHERDEAMDQLESLLALNAQLKTNQTTAELLSLRRELARLKSANAQNNRDPLESAAKDLVGKMNLLKQRLEQMPDKNIPELQYLDNEAWARIAQTAKLDTDAGVRQALSSLRNLAKEKFAPQMGQALQAYAQANAGELPAEVSQLKPYFELPVEDATLARYQMIQAGNVRDLQPSQLIVAEKAAVDDEHDYLFQIGLNILKSQGVGQNAVTAVSSAWSSRTPSTPDEGK